MRSACLALAGDAERGITMRQPTASRVDRLDAGGEHRKSKRQETPGDLIVADFDGVVAIPADAVDEAVPLATDKVTRENHSREELMRGAYLIDVYRRYGVL